MTETRHRGEIWLVNLDPAIGAEIKKTRPAVMISNNLNNQYASTVTVLPVSDKGEKVYPFEVALPAGAGLTKESKVRCQQIRTIDKIRLVKLLGRLEEEPLCQIQGALLFHLGINI